MASHSLVSVLILSLVQWAISSPQGALSPVAESAQFLQTAAPDLAAPAISSSGTTVSCGGCYVVADVAGLVWYSEVFVNTAATAMVSVGAATNGTRATRTSIVQNEGDFTFGPGVEATGAALNQINFDSSITIAGAVLNSPTAYNVFTAYSVTSATLSDGICVTDKGSQIVLSSAYTEVLSSANGKVFLDQNGEQQFINFLGFSTCSGGGESVVPTALVQVTNVTATTTTTGGPSIGATQSLSLSVALESALATSASQGASPTLSLASASAPVIVVGNKTVTPTAHPVALPTVNGTVLSVASTGFASPTNGNLTLPSSPIPFVGGAGRLRQEGGFMAAWFVGMSGLGLGVYLL